MMGGIAAVIWTDVVQSAMLFLGAFTILFLLIDQLPDGFLGTLKSLNAQGKTDPFNASLDPSKVATIWTGVVAMSIYHVVVYGVNQMMVQRTLAAKSLGDAKKAYLCMAYVAFFIFVLFFGMGILFYSYYGGKVFENENLIVLDFVAKMGYPGLMGVATASIVAAAMSSLDSSLNSMATVTTLDFYEKFFRKDGTPEHYLAASRWFTFGWAVLIVIPAIIFTKSGGSVLEILSKIGSFFVGAKLAMFGLGFFSKHTTERGLIIGVLAGFVGLWYVETYADIAWPWYCAIGGLISIVVAWVASVLLDGFQTDYSVYSVKGQQAMYREQGLPEKQDGWYVVSGRVDKASYVLLVYFVLCVAGLWVFQTLI
jgi:SSS family solute:Na+ symporter